MQHQNLNYTKALLAEIEYFYFLLVLSFDALLCPLCDVMNITLLFSAAMFMTSSSSTKATFLRLPKCQRNSR
jgi:hypothetical protein